MTTLKDLLAQRVALDEQITSLTQTQRIGAIARVRALMEENGLSLVDLGSKARAGEKGKAKIPKTGQKVAAKYRDEAGSTWSGRGLQPRWLRAAIEAGKKIEDFAI